MGHFSSQGRSEQLTGLDGTETDLLVIGGGITGCGIAFDAATRGIDTTLVEMQDFAAGTSSRSTKLVHGGLRYLKQLHVKMVAEVGRERSVVYENGPHVTTPEWMLLPIYKGGTFGKFSTSLGLLFYDYLAAVRKTERRTMLSVAETLGKEPLLKKDGLKGGGYYVEYRTDDARLTIEVAKAAAEKGAKLFNYAKVEEFLYKDGKVAGALIKDQLSGNEIKVYARKIVNAAGPWVDTLREKDSSKGGKALRLTKGVHLVIDQMRFPLKQAVYFDTPDGRMVFAIPRDGKAYVGTTDTFYEGDIAHPHMTEEDRDYIIDAINFMFPGLRIGPEDIESSWAGLRPLIYEEGKDPSEISRKDEIWQSPSGLITIAGGKLTGYRKMAEMAVDLVSELLAKEGIGSFSKCNTKNLPISGGEVGGSANFSHFIKQSAEAGVSAGLSGEQAERLARFYGSNAEKLFARVKAGSPEAQAAGLPLDLYLMLVYAMEEEMAVKPVDFFIRRTGSVFFNIQGARKWKEPAITFMAQKLSWSDEQIKQYREELEREIHYAVVPAGKNNES